MIITPTLHFSLGTPPREGKSTVLTAITCSLYLTPQSASDSTLRVANANERFFAFSSYLTHQQLCH